MRCGLALILLILAIPAARAQALRDRFFIASDGERLHYIEAGPADPHTQTLVFVPGWLMPAWIWREQMAAFAPRYRVIAFDPRSQGESAIAASGHEPGRRGQDIAELLARLGPDPVVLAGWSLGVLDVLAYLTDHGERQVAGLVLIDNSVGEAPPPQRPSHPRATPKRSREVAMAAFVRGMFRRPQPPAFLDALTASALRTPPRIAAALLAYPVPRSYWRTAIYATDRPILYVVRPRLAGQAANLAAHHADVQSVVFADAGHALFIDDAARFDALMQGFIDRRVWPPR